MFKKFHDFIKSEFINEEVKIIDNNINYHNGQSDNQIIVLVDDKEVPQHILDSLKMYKNLKLQESFTPKRVKERTDIQLEKLKKIIDTSHDDLDVWRKFFEDINSFKNQSNSFLEGFKKFTNQEKIELIPYLQKIVDIAETTDSKAIRNQTEMFLKESEILRDKRQYKFIIDKNLSDNNVQDDEPEIFFKYEDIEGFEYGVDFYFRYDNDLVLFIPHRVLKSGSKTRFDGHWELVNSAYVCNFTMTEKEFNRMMLVLDNDKTIQVFKNDAYNFKINIKKTT